MFGIYLIAFLQMISSCQKAEPETYLIPSDYVGRVQIIFNQDGKPIKYKNEYGRDSVYVPQNGVPAKYENGRRIYQIPSAGILVTQFKENNGFIDRKYFTVSNNGERIPLQVFHLEHPKKDSTSWNIKDNALKGIFGDGVSGSYGNMHIFFQDFIVSDFKTLDSFYTKPYQAFFNNKIEKITGLRLQ